MLKKLPKFMGRLVYITAAVLICAIVIVAVMTPNILQKEQIYLDNYAKEKALQSEVNDLNLKYYAHILENGIFEIKDASGKNVGYSVIYGKIKKFYKYRIYINGSQLVGDSVESNSPNLEVIVEEYFLKTTSDIVPITILHKFSYLRTKGLGQKEMQAADFITIAGGGVFTSTTVEGEFYTRLKFNFENLPIGGQASFSVIDRELSDNLGLLFPQFEVRRTI